MASRDGATAIEYGLIAAMLTVFLVGVTSLSGGIGGIYNDLLTTIAGIISSTFSS
ncbi:MAG: Flp family type IVb pilin [Pseudomonadota bacterium]